MLPEAIWVQVGTGCVAWAQDMGESDKDLAFKLQCTETRPQLTHPGSVKVLYLGTMETAFLHSTLIFFPHKWVRILCWQQRKSYWCTVWLSWHFSHVFDQPLCLNAKTTILLKLSVLAHPFPYTKTEENRRQYSNPKSSINQRDS